jgi:hypothetical protein
VEQSCTKLAGARPLLRVTSFCFPSRQTIPSLAIIHSIGTHDCSFNEVRPLRKGIAWRMFMLAARWHTFAALLRACCMKQQHRVFIADFNDPRYCRRIQHAKLCSPGRARAQQHLPRPIAVRGAADSSKSSEGAAGKASVKVCLSCDVRPIHTFSSSIRRPVGVTSSRRDSTG